MNARWLAVATAIILALTVATSCVAAESEAEPQSTSGLVSVSTESETVHVDSGSTKRLTFYVVNLSDHYVTLDVSVSNLGEFASSNVAISVGGVLSNLLQPRSSVDKGVAAVVVSVEADGYAETSELTGLITVKATDISEESRPLETVEIPLTVDITSVFSSESSYNKFFGVFPNTLGEPLNNVWFTVLATFIIWILATIVVSELIIPLFTHFAGNRKTSEEKAKLRDKLTKIITGIMIIVAINECLHIAGASAEINKFMQSISWIFYVIFGAMLGWQIYLFIVTAFLKGLEEESDVSGFDTSLLPLFKMIGELVIGVAACCAVLAAFGVDLAGIMVSAGVVSLGITLGAQSTLNQFFSGIVLLATRPFRSGDFVKINDTTYIVKKVKLMYTEFKNWDGDQVVTMPNNTVSSATILNLTKGNPWTRISVFIDVAYGSDIDLCKKCLVEGAKKHPHVISDGRVTPPSPRLQEFAASGITFKLAVWVDDYDNSSVYAGQVRELIYKELVDNGVEIPYNRLQIDILSDATHASE